MGQGNGHFSQQTKKEVLPRDNTAGTLSPMIFRGPKIGKSGVGGKQYTHGNRTTCTPIDCDKTRQKALGVKRWDKEWDFQSST